MIKITDIEALLSSPFDMDIDLWGIDLKTIQELHLLYGGEVIVSDQLENTWYGITTENVSLTLNTKKKLKTNYAF